LFRPSPPSIFGVMAASLSSRLRTSVVQLAPACRCASVKLQLPRVVPPLMAAARSAATRAQFYYQSDRVPTSLVRTGHVGTIRDGQGSDGEFFGVDPIPMEMEVHDGRRQGLTLDSNGFELVQHAWDHIDYYNNADVLNCYYPEVEALVCRQVGAKSCVAFDHNIRAKSKKSSGELLKDGGNAIQEPLISYGVHNDYTAASSIARIRQLAEPPKHNDTLRPRLGSKPALDPEQLDSLLEGRWIFTNVWRNIADTPVQRFPLGLADARSVSREDLIVFEIRYSDRVGENYFARHSSAHRWFYFPELTKDEVVLLKVWDSRGRDFVESMPCVDGAKAETALTKNVERCADNRTKPQQVRTIAFF